MGISFADIREADRLDRSYAEAQRRHAGGGDPGWIIISFAAKWGLPFLPLLPLAWGGEVLGGAWIIVGLIAVWQAALHFGKTSACRTELEVLRFPEPAALLFSRALRHGCWFLWCGVALGAWRLAELGTPWADAHSVAIVAAAACGSVFTFVGVLHRTAARHNDLEPGLALGCLIPGVALLVVVALVDLLVDRPRVPVVVGLAFLIAVRSTRILPWWQTLVDGAVLSLWYGTLRIDPAVHGDRALWLAAGACVGTIVRTAQILRDGVPRARFVASDEKAAAADATVDGAPFTSLVRRPSPGVGITRALARKWWIGVRGMFTPSATVRGPRRFAAFALLALVAAPVALAWHLRGAILAVFAVWSGATDTPEAAVFAVAAAAFSPSILETDLDERRHLFGVDYTEQVRHAMRTWFVVGCIPCVVAAAVVLVATGAPSGALAAACFLGACLLLRFGWNGLRGESAFASGCLATIALGGALLWFEPTADILLPLAAGIGGLGLLGTVARFRSLDEPALRAQMRLKH